MVQTGLTSSPAVIYGAMRELLTTKYRSWLAKQTETPRSILINIDALMPRGFFPSYTDCRNFETLLFPPYTTVLKPKAGQRLIDLYVIVT